MSTLGNWPQEELHGLMADAARSAYVSMIEEKFEVCGRLLSSEISRQWNQGFRVITKHDKALATSYPTKNASNQG